MILLGAAMPAAASPPSFSAAPASPRAAGLDSAAAGSGHHELWLGVATVALSTVAVFNDGWISDESMESSSAGLNRLSRAFEPAGNAAVVAPAILLVYGAARMTGHDELARAAQRVGASVVAAGIATFALKEAAGRERPRESPGDADVFQPFSGHASFPSGHSAVAFTTATAITRETHARWVPWAVYPAAALVAWSRVHDQEHWTSDVMVGAALGTWTSIKVDDLLRRRAALRKPVSLRLSPARGGMTAGVAVQF